MHTKNKNLSATLVLSTTNSLGFIAQNNYFSEELANKDLTNYKIVNKMEFAYNPARINVGSIALMENFEVGIVISMYVVFKCKNKINHYS